MPNALETLYDDNPPQGKALVKLLRELQALKITVVDGAAADTNIPVAGLGATDLVKAILYFPIATGTVTSVADLTAELQAQTAGNIQIATTVTSGGKLIVIWYDKTTGG